MKRRNILTAIVIMACMFSSSAVFAGQASFTDTKVSAWFYPYVSTLVEKGGIAGYPDKTFRPQNTITNAEFLKTVVGSTLGEKKAASGHWAGGYVAAAQEAGIITAGEMPQSEWDKPITRQKMAVIVARTTEKVLKEKPVEDAAEYQKDLKDYASICDYCKDYVLQVYAQGIISGYPDGTFGGEKTATRAEACSIITRMLEPAVRTLDKVAAPGRTGPIADIIKNPEDIFLGDDLKNYVIVDAEPYHMRLWEFEKDPELKCIVMDKDPHMTFFVVDGVVKDSLNDGRRDDGTYDIRYSISDPLVSDRNIDIETVDYIGSYNTVNPVVKLIPNPFRHQ